MRPQHTAFWTAFFLTGCLLALIAGWSIVWYRCRMTADPPVLLEASPVILDMNKILFVPLIGKVVSIWRSYLDSDMLERIREADDD